jgi:hypothetical protein
MTRVEAIAEINARLASLDDDEVRAVADMVSSIGEPSVLPRTFSDRERDLIAQSKADFRNGDVLSPSELDDFLDTAAAQRAAARGA